MRCTILVLSLAIIYAWASPIAEDHIVPEESLFALDDDLSEAQQKINEMTAAGASDKDCRKLVTETRKDVQANVDACQKTLNALPRGDSCPGLGQQAVKTATEAKSKADKHVTHCAGQVTKATSASVNFGSRTFSSLTEGKCASFYTSTAYTTAETTYNTAVTAHTRAKGAAAEAATALKNAVAAAAKEKHDCECRVKADHESKFTQLSAAHAANQKTWEFACKVECVLDGKTNCRCSAAPQCKRAKLTAAVQAATARCDAAAKKRAADAAAKKKAAADAAAAKKKAAEDAAAAKKKAAEAAAAKKAAEAAAAKKKAAEAAAAAKKAAEAKKEVIVVNGQKVANCGAKNNFVVLYSGPNCSGRSWTVKGDTNFCSVSGMNDNVDSIQGCGRNVHILHHCDKNSATIWKNNGNSFAKCQNLSASAKAKGPSYVLFK